MKNSEIKDELLKLKQSIDKLIFMLGKDKYKTAVDNKYEKRGQNGN